MVCMLNFRIRNQRKQNETENFSIIGMDGGTLFRKLKRESHCIFVQLLKEPEGRDMRYGDLFNISAIIVKTGSI